MHGHLQYDLLNCNNYLINLRSLKKKENKRLRKDCFNGSDVEWTGTKLIIILDYTTNLSKTMSGIGFSGLGGWF